MTISRLPPIFSNFICQGDEFCAAPTCEHLVLIHKIAMAAFNPAIRQTNKQPSSENTQG